MKKQTKRKVTGFITLFIAITFGFFMWQLWSFLDTLIGNSMIVLVITGGISLGGLLFGYITLDKLIGRFT